MNTKGTIQNLLDELVVGNPHSDVIQTHMDVILTWLARPDSEKVEEFRNAYLQRKISDEILRGYVLFILEQRLFSNENLAAHQVLALPSDAAKEQIKSRYQKLIRIYHPDRGIGDPRILHQHAEKINQAYQHLVTTNISTNSIRPSHTVKAPPVTATNDTTDSFVNTVVSRKLRNKLGNPKQFQMVFFGSVATICLLLILLIYIQPDTVDSERSYSKERAQTEKIDQASNVNKLVEEEKIAALTADNTLPVSADFENSALRDNDSKSNDDPVENITKLKQATVEIESSNKDSQVVDKLVDQDLEENVIQQVDETNLADVSEEVEKKAEAEITSLLSQGVDSNSITQSEEKLISTKKIELIPNKVEQDSPTPKESDSENKIAKQLKVQENSPKKVSDKKTLQSDQMAKGQFDKLKKPPQTIVKIEVLEPKTVPEKNIINPQKKSDQVQVEEIQVSKVIKPTQSYSVANLFERRFARKFVIKYLESIEQGNIRLINDFLSDGLSISGVSNNKHNYLKNTTQMISDSERRSYRINFVGDVLRLGKGLFRVTLKEHRTVLFKNDRKAQTSSTKSYDIKRYKNGSEIVSISDV